MTAQIIPCIHRLPAGHLQLADAHSVLPRRDNQSFLAIRRKDFAGLTAHVRNFGAQELPVKLERFDAAAFLGHGFRP